MFLGRIEEARALYLSLRSETEPSTGRPFGKIIQKDFDVLRKAGLAHPAMSEIVASLGLGAN